MRLAASLAVEAGSGEPANSPRKQIGNNEPRPFSRNSIYTELNYGDSSLNPQIEGFGILGVKQAIAANEENYECQCTDGNAPNFCLAK